MERMWNDETPCSNPSDFLFVVVACISPLFRGRTSPRGCVMNAVREARMGHNFYAIRWLQAGASNDGAIQTSMTLHMGDVITFLRLEMNDRVPLEIPVEEKIGADRQEMHELLHRMPSNG